MFAIGSDGRLYRSVFGGAWGDWAPVEGASSTPPGVTCLAGKGLIGVFDVASDGSVQMSLVHTT
jgi:hypothetical protein